MPHGQNITLFQRELIAINHIVGGVWGEVDFVQDIGAGDAVYDFGGYGQIRVGFIT